MYYLLGVCRRNLGGSIEPLKPPCLRACGRQLSRTQVSTWQPNG